MFFLEVLVIFVLILIIQRWRKLRRWDHFPGFKSYSNIPFLGHTYKLGARPYEKVSQSLYILLPAAPAQVNN